MPALDKDFCDARVHIASAREHVRWHRAQTDGCTLGLRCALDSLMKAFTLARKDMDRDLMSAVCRWRNQIRAKVNRLEPWRASFTRRAASHVRSHERAA